MERGEILKFKGRLRITVRIPTTDMYLEKQLVNAVELLRSPIDYLAQSRSIYPGGRLLH